MSVCPTRTLSRGFGPAVPCAIVWIALALVSVADGLSQTPTRSKPFPELLDARQWGPFLVEPSFSIDNLGYEDNVFRTATDPISDVRLTMGPSLRGQFQVGPNVAVTFNEKLTSEFFLENSLLNNTDNSFDAQLDILVGPFLFTTDAGWFTFRGRPNSEIDQRPRSNNNTFDQQVRVFLGPRTDISASFATRDLEFVDRDPFSVTIDPDGDGMGTPVSLGEALNREEQTFTAELGWRFGGGSRLLLRHRSRNSDFESSTVARDVDDDRTYLGVQFSPNSTLSGRLLVGRAEIVNKDSTYDSIPFDGSVSDVSVTVRPTSSTRIVAKVERDVQFSTYDQNLYYTNEIRRLSGETFLRSGWGMQAQVSREDLEYPAVNTFSPPIGDRRLDQIDLVFGGLLYRTRTGLQFGLGYGRRKRDSNSPSVIDEETYVSTSGTFSF